GQGPLVELDPAVDRCDRGIHDVGPGLLELDEPEQFPDLVLGVSTSIESAGLEDMIPLPGLVLVGQDVVVRQDQDCAVVAAADECAQGSCSDLEVPDRGPDPERPGPLLMPGGCRPLGHLADVADVDLAPGPLLDGFDLRAVLQAPLLDPDGQPEVVLP